MNCRIHLHKTDTAKFLTVLKKARADRAGEAMLSYILCAAALARRRQELADERQKQEPQTSALTRMIVNLKASQKAHLKLIRQLESD